MGHRRDTPRPDRSALARLHFGARGRARARARRVGTWGALLSTVAMMIGLPGSSAGIDALERLGGRSELLPARRGVETTESAAAVMRFRTGVFEARPTPAPTPSASEPTATPETVTGGSVPEIIYAAADEFGVDGDYLLAVADCESGLDPHAHNPAGYYGLFQFDESTWASYGYGSIYDADAQARTAARLLAAGQASRWPNCA